WTFPKEIEMALILKQDERTGVVTRGALPIWLRLSLLYGYNVRKIEEAAMKTASAKLTEKFQITIPTEVRRHLGLKAGDVVYLAEEGGQVVLRAARGGWTASTQGLGADLWRHEGGAAAIEREREAWD